ncbi:unnamed protein product [Caenorhabditis sp. 36 PRJEB53466]|nr:unnamed protein product [Caenorhabditis sp. 36 PRJEB53466]
MDSSGASTSGPLPPSQNSGTSGTSQSEFGELSPAEFAKVTYFSFAQPVFSASIVVNQPNSFVPSVLPMSQNFNTINYPVFTKYGYYSNGTYHMMVKKGITRLRLKSLWRRGTPTLETIVEEPEVEAEQDVQKKEKEKKSITGSSV